MTVKVHRHVLGWTQHEMHSHLKAVVKPENCHLMKDVGSIDLCWD